MHSDLNIPIETNRLIIRPYRVDDAKWYYRMGLKNKEHLTRYESENPVISIQTEADAVKVIKDFVSLWDEQRYRFMGVFLKKTTEFVAQIYLGKINADLPEFMIGYFADIDQTGNGYVSEAVTAVVSELFATAGAHRIQIETDDTNTRSIRVAQRCGFTREGHLRENKKNSDGTISGTIFFGLLKSEFQD
jgi:ribosomal-protein-alanine N-acetyltransferase